MKGKSERNGSVNAAHKPQRLVGWLVSYALDERGKAFELRAGRYLISRQGLLSKDGQHAERTITLEKGDISTPHLAMHASGKHALLVQDIFSEAGSYLTKAGGGQEERISGPTRLEHGDWIRIGSSTRFQVCLIDGTGR